MTDETRFIATPTMADFMESPKYVRVLAGPIGGGKSVCCAHDLMAWSTEQQPNSKGERKTRFLIVRNTADQLRSTTMKTVFDWFPPGVVGVWKATEKTLYVSARLSDGTVVKSEWMFIALDTPDDVRKALSLEATGLWGNECRELHPDVVDGLLMRVNRYPSPKDGGATRAGAIFDTNMPEDGSWWHDRMEANTPKNWGVFLQPSACMPLEQYVEMNQGDPPENLVFQDSEGDSWVIDENADNYSNLSPNNPGMYYRETGEGKTKDFINVYLRVRYGRSLHGFPVYEQTFIPEKHIAQNDLLPLQSESYPLCIGLDFGRTPAAIIGQVTPRGRVHVLSEVIAENMGLEKFLEFRLKPHLYERYPGYPLFVAPDPAGAAKTQVGETSPFDVLRKMGFRLVTPRTNLVEPRISAVEGLLARFPDGEPGFLVDRRCEKLVKGFRFGYRWKMNKKGDLDGKEPEKNEFSHPHDALQYFALAVDQGARGGFVQSQRREIRPAPRHFV